MNKDLKIAVVVIAIIMAVAIFENPSPKRHAYSGQFQHKELLTGKPRPNKSAAKVASNSADKSCQHKGIELKGNVQFVDSFPDLKIKYVNSFADIHVQFVSSFPDDCGQWKEVSSFPDFKVQVVDSFPDIEVKKVNAFPGMQ